VNKIVEIISLIIIIIIIIKAGWLVFLPVMQDFPVSLHGLDTTYPFFIPSM
jgi:hypothetical protein